MWRTGSTVVLDILTARRRQIRIGAILTGLLTLLMPMLAATAAPTNHNAIAVIIGNKNYDGGIPEVSFAYNDADAFRKFVIEGLGYREGNIIDLRDATFNQMVTVFGNKETHEGKLFDYIRPGESDVTVFYSGHGVPGLKDRQAYLLPSNGDPNRAEISGYPIATLYKNLNKLPARMIRVFIDACFSGETPKGMLIKSASGIRIEPKVPEGSSRMVILTAAQGDQLASWDEEAKHGLFTKHLLEALYGVADGDKYGDGDSKVTLAEVGRYLKLEMSYQARRRFGRVQEASLTGSGSSVLVPEIVDNQHVASVAVIPKPEAKRALPPNSTGSGNTTSSLVVDLSQTYGYYKGQKLSIERIQKEFPSLSAMAYQAQLKFDLAYKGSYLAVENKLREMMGEKWPTYKKQIFQRLSSGHETTQITAEQAATFVRTVSLRTKGQIQTPILETLLSYNPVFQRNPAAEMLRGYKETYRTNGHAKARGVDFQIEYPRSWKHKEGKRPHVIKLFVSENGRGQDSMLLMVKDIPLPRGYVISDQELKDFFSTSELKEMIPKGADFISAQPIILDGQRGGMIKFDQSLKRLDKTIFFRAIHYVTIFNNKLIFIQCMVGSFANSSSSLETRFARMAPLFGAVANSFVIQSKY
jgi:hypothetical protein